MYSCRITLGSNVDERRARRAHRLSVVPGKWNRYICMVGGMPSGGVLMLALSMWLPSGQAAVGVGAVEGVQQHRVAAAQLEVAGLRR